MAWTPSTPELGIQPIAVSSTTQNHPIGTIITAYDPVLGSGEFIYLPGVASTVVGSLVTYQTGPTVATAFTTLAPNTAHLAAPVAVAMSANVAAGFGWYQIAGAATIKKTATKVSPAVPLFLSSTVGRVQATAVSGKEVLNCVSMNTATVASATSTIVAIINRPFAQGQAV